MTGLAAANICGEKIPMFVIGKSKKPRCLKEIKRTLFRYRTPKKSWMDSELFEEWVREQDRKFTLKKRKVTLATDNCTAHPNIENLKSITLYFLSPITASCLQPMDQGVIQSCKCCSRIIQKIITAIDNGKQIPSVSVLEAMKILVLSRSKVSETAIIDCFRKADFKEGVSHENDDPFSESKSSIDQLQQRDENLVPCDFIYEDMLKVDDNTAVMEGVMIYEEVVQETIEVLEEEVQEEDEEDIDEMLKKPTAEEIRKARYLCKFFDVY